MSRDPADPGGQEMVATVRFGIQSKLFYTLLGIIVLTLASGGLLIETSLSRWRLEGIKKELVLHLRLIEGMVRESPGPLHPRTLAPLADHLGQTLGMRVTFIDGAGRVVGDSAVAAAELARLENHAARPEVAEALQQVYGEATRHSSTVAQDMFYVAHAFHKGTEQVVVRLARSLRDVQGEMVVLRLMVLLAVLFALGLAVLMSGVVSRLATRSLRDLIEQTVQIAGGNAAARIEVSSQDEIGGLARSFNALLNQLELLMASVTLERDRLQAVLEGIRDGVIAVDRDGLITLVNHAAIDLLELEGNPVNHHLGEVLPAEQLEGLLPPYCEEVCQGEIVVQGPLPRHLQVMSSCTPADGGSIMLLHDVTEMRRLEQLQRRFVSSASHELRTPVSIIRLNAETLLEGVGEDPQVVGSLVDAIQRQALRLSQLISDLLDLSQLESGNYPLRPAEVTAREVVERVGEGLQPLMHERGMHFGIEMAPGLKVYADASALEQVLTNLVSNAVKYVQPGGRVEVRAGRQGSQVRFEVEDNGPGIAREHRHLLFNHFYRVDPGRSREMGGTGLGLTIVKHLVEVMGGEVGLEEKATPGSRFWFTLPGMMPEPGAVVADQQPYC